eukprot:m.334777 g.334777  ORF g.334777 m.334777 type:complete len:172 (-) comp17435_c0_seq1:156-671(-)
MATTMLRHCISRAAALRLAAPVAHIPCGHVVRQLTVSPVRSWFGFGMQRTPQEIAQEGQADVPIYAQDFENDEDEYLQGEELWSAEERLERQSIAQEINSMSEQDPPAKPDIIFFEKVFDMLIKYDDWRGVITVRELVAENKLVEGEELKAKLDKYMEEATQRSYHDNESW